MLYGEEIFVSDRAKDAATATTAIALEASTGAIYTRTMNIPGVVRRFGFSPTVLFNYATQTRKGVLTLYKDPAADSSKKVALGTINLEDADAVGMVYFSDIQNKVVDQVPVQPGNAQYNAGDQLVVEITTQAAGGGGIAGDFQPLMWWNNRGENTGNQGQLVDRTPAIVGV